MCLIYSDSCLAIRPGKEKGDAGGAPAKRDHRVGGKPRTQGGVTRSQAHTDGQTGHIGHLKISLAKAGSK